MGRFLLVQRYDMSSPFRPNMAARLKIPNATVEQVLQQYQGFEGELIDLIDARSDPYENMSILKKCLKIKEEKNCLLYFVDSDFNAVGSDLQNDVVKVGYDVGICEEDATLYSSIFNEIIFGHLAELIEFNKFLNNNLLFPDSSFAIEYIKVHNALSAQGKDVEDYMEMSIYEIWKYV